jgi:S1-C subfamily serine protease
MRKLKLEIFVRKFSTKSAIVGIFVLAVALFLLHESRNTQIVKVIKRWGPSVVNISTERIISLQSHPFWGKYSVGLDRALFQNQAIVIGTLTLNGIGSGVVVSKDGLILTNAHVINMANRVFVILSDGKAREASLAAVNPSMDLALIKIDPPKKLKPIRLAKDVMIGETVISIGNPLGLQNSVSAGIISGTDRSLSSSGAKSAITGLLQTDASINQGSSGGALLNLNGELVGVSFAVAQGAQSIGFAIPVEKIRIILKDYRDAMAARAKKK